MTGTGFVVGSSDREVFILTAKHVVEEAHEIRVQFYDISYEEGLPATLRRAGPEPNPDSDFAVVAVEKSARKGAPLPAFKTLKVGRSPSTLGRKLATVGHPLSREWQCKSGVIEGLRYRQSDRMFLSTTIHKGGISGAPVFDENGILLGMATESAPEGGGVALNINYLLRFMSDEWRIPTNFLQEPTRVVGIPKVPPSGPGQGNENPPPDQPPSDPRLRLDGGRQVEIPRPPLDEIVRQEDELRKLIEEGKQLRNRPDSADQKKGDFYIWKNECGNALDIIRQAQKDSVRKNPPDYRAEFEAITKLDEKGLSEAELLKQIKDKINEGIVYVGGVIKKP